ncbi:response regulator [Polymorphobacter sp.]|uniref:response regulator n=1 Tax=Polymorphobacter sp. TaxID=1909290 RepID=UPI003F71EF20
MEADSTMTSPRILVVDDDAGIRALVAENLGRYGYDVAVAENASAMDRLLEGQAFDLIILDIMMPGEDGLSVCRRIAAADGPPVILLSALGADVDRIIGLEIGADDYLTKPCNPRELLAYVRAVLRRAGRRPADGARADVGRIVEFAGWQLDMMSRFLRRADGVIINLSDGEFSLLRAFVERPGRVLTRDQLLDAARGPDSEAFDRAIDVQISRLRRKLGGDDTILRTVRNEGYMFVPKLARR